MVGVAKGDIGTRIKRELQDRGMQAAHLARLIEVTPQRLDGWLTGRNEPSAEILVLISQKMPCSIFRLLGLENPDILRGDLTPTPPPAMTKRLVPSYGLVPSSGWKKPLGEWIEVSVDAEVDVANCIGVTVRNDRYAPHLTEGRRLLFRTGSRLREGKFCLFLSDENDLIIATPTRVDGAVVLREPGTGADRIPGKAKMLGHLVHQEETDLDGIGP